MSTTTPIVDALSSMSLFADLTRPDLEAITHIFEEVMFSDGERILRQGFTGSGFYIIVDGEAQVRLGDNELAKLGRGDFFGEVSILLGEPPTADIVALGPLSCLVLAGQDVQAFLESYPKVMFRLLQAEALRLKNTLRWRS